MLPGIAAIPLGSPPAAPVITYVSDDGYTSPVSVVGSSPASASINVYVNGSPSKTTTADSSGNWSVNNVALVQGNNTITATATVAGKTSPPSAAYNAPVKLAFNGSAVLQLSAATYTFNNVPIGAANDNRYVIIAINAATALSPGTVSSVTVNGQTATIVYQATQSGYTVAYAGVMLPTGTTATVVVTFGASAGTCGIGSYSALVTSTTPILTANNGSSSGVASLSITGANLSSAGFVLAQVINTFSAAKTHTWSGLNTKDADDYIVYNTYYYTRSYASQHFASSQNNMTITETTDGASVAAVKMSAVGWAA
jgi:hypothetical protein